VGHHFAVKHTVWVIAAALVVSVFPGQRAPGTLLPRVTGNTSEQHERTHEHVDAESLKLLILAQRKSHAGPTRGWLTLREARRYKPRPPFFSLSYDFEDPRRALLPPRIDPPPDGLA
jgi:hypothetical protein